MMAAEIATARLESRTVRVDLVGAPDVERTDGRRLISERARVETYYPTAADDGAGKIVYVVVTGRAVLADSTVGQRLRVRVFGLERSMHSPAPTWLVEALKAAGVTW